jgi:hypothetical protein
MSNLSNFVGYVPPDLDYWKRALGLAYRIRNALSCELIPTAVYRISGS